MAGFTILDLGPISNYANKTLIYTMSNQANNLYKYISFLNCDSTGENKTVLASLGDSSNTMSIEVGTSYTYDRLALRLYISDGIAGQVYHINDILIRESGTTDTWEPYSGGYVSPSPNWEQPINNVTGDNTIRVENRNLVTTLSSGYWDRTNNTLKQTDSTVMKSFSRKLKSGTYILSCNTKLNILRAYTTYDNSSNTIFPANNTNVNEYAMTLSEDTMLYITVRRNDNTDWLETDLLQLEQGSTATPYIPHEEQTVTFPLSTGQYMAEGDYLADDGIHHKWGQVVLNGDNGTITLMENSNGYSRWRFTGLQNTLSLKSPNNFICNKLRLVPQSEAGQMNQECIVKRTSDANFQIVLLNSRLTEVTESALNSYLSANNMLVQYELATETIEPYTEAQATAWNAIKELHTYLDYTQVSQTNDGLPFILKVSVN